MFSRCSNQSEDTSESVDQSLQQTETELDTSQIRLQKATASEVLEVVQESDASVKMVNVWATWCQPCREEFPDLLELRENYKDQGFELIFVSADFEGELPQVKQFLADHSVDFTTYMKTGKDMKFINTLHDEWSGALPATLVFGPEGTLQDFWQGKADYAKLESAIKPYIQ
jgi:thiol-disulfide isomerase/thioredoxin